MGLFTKDKTSLKIGLIGILMLSMATLFFWTGSLTEKNEVVDTPVGEFKKDFFKIDNKKEVWRGVTIPLETGTTSIVKAPAVPVKGDSYPTWRYRANSEGIREEEIPDQKPSNTTRILFLGNSIIMGNFVNETNRFTEILERKLNDNSSKNYRVINAGLVGAGAFDQYIFLKTIGIDYKPDVVVGHLFWYSDISRAENRKLKLTLESMADSTEKARNSELMIGGNYTEELEWKDSEVNRYGLKLANFARDRGIKPVFMASGWNHIDTYRNWSQKNELTFIQPPPRFRNVSSSLYRYPDGHYNIKGHRRLAEYIHGELTSSKGDLSE